MPWFYYSGNVAKTVPVKKGVSIAVRPHSRVEILEPNLREVQALKNKGLLRRTGKQPGASMVATLKPVTPEDIKAVTPKSAMAQKIAEKGVTTDKTQAPRKPKGQPEMTDGEVVAANKDQIDEQNTAEETPDKSDKVSAQGSVDESSDLSSSADVVDVLPIVDGSPDDNSKGDGAFKSNKKKRSKKK